MPTTLAYKKPNKERNSGEGLEDQILREMRVVKASAHKVAGQNPIGFELEAACVLL